MKKNKIKINFYIKKYYKNYFPTIREINKWLKLIMLKNNEITIHTVDIFEMKKINFIYCNKNYPTNILSFPSKISQYNNSLFLGDLIICPEIIKKESIIQKKLIKIHWAHIIIHGTLHLLGYNHYNIKQLNVMQKIEINTMKKLGYKNPYII